MRDPVAAVTEAEASGETAALFADIRAVYGVSVVNLVWRHLATMPGALAHVWGSLRPLYLDGTVAREADALRAAIAVPRPPAVPGFVLAAAGLDDAAMDGVRLVMTAYDRTNAMALVALSAARARLAGVPAAPWRPGAAHLPAPAALALPPLVDLAAMAPATAELVAALNRMGATHPAPVLASMYRNLAHWPAFLAVAWGILAPLQADGQLVRAIAGGLELAQARAAALPRVADAPSLASDQAGRVDAALALFTGDAIARMLVVTRVLRTAVG
ncbi:MAG: hypothetical protein IT555_08230 [Acetobacteraceae bacterium]|nr:hypothetical protein [Acetobacteraceae bacterium]